MLTAYYALDMRNAEQPGLVVIEEPDIAIHPLLLGNLVDLLRSYTERKGYSRQFILTTHNPQMLNYFEPSEVRIVERDASGVTTVNPVNEKVAEVWRQHDGAFNLGSLWTTRLIGGVPQ
jgi:predicted ATPase